MKINIENVTHYTRHMGVLRSMSTPAKKDLFQPWRDDTWIQLRRLEARAHRLAERCCNEKVSEEEQDHLADLIENRVIKLFGKKPRGFFMNWDPRGYALKIKKPSRSMQRDWGAYGILAPEF